MQDQCCSSLQEWQSPHIQVAAAAVELHREAKNSSDWAARREWTQTALTGWAAFMVRNDDAAVNSTAGVASFTAPHPPLSSYDHLHSDSQKETQTCMLRGIFSVAPLTLQKAKHRSTLLRRWCNLPCAIPMITLLLFSHSWNSGLELLHAERKTTITESQSNSYTHLAHMS